MKVYKAQAFLDPKTIRSEFKKVCTNFKNRSGSQAQYV